MHSLKTAFKLNFKLVNPYIIKPEYQQLTSSNPQILALEDQNKCLGLKIGQYVQLQYQNQKKNYVPISRIDDPGTVDFLVRDMGQKVGEQSFSKKLVNLKQGQHLKIRGPKTNYIYQGYGHITTQHFSKKFTKIGIIAYQTGITATYSLIQSIYNNQDNQTGISLLWLGQKSQDFIFLQQLSFLTQQSKLFMNVMLTKFQKGFPGMVIDINQRIGEKYFKEYMPPVSDDTVIFLAGTTEQVNQMKNVAMKLGYKYIV